MFWPLHHRALTAAHEPGGPRKTLALLTLSLAMLLSALDMTIINVALPSFAHQLGASSSELQWIVDSYTIVLAGFLLLGNGLADRFGRRKAFVAGLLLFLLSTLAATVASSASMLIAARAVMGLGAALVLGPALSLLAVIFPPEERARALGIWTIFGALGVALGPVIGGILLHSFWWGSVFLVTAPVCILGAIGGIVALPESRRPDDKALDVVGALISVVGLGTLLFGIIEGPHLGWGTPVVVGALVIGAASIAGFVVWELRSAEPMFDPRVFQIGPVIGGTLTLFVIYVSFIGTMFLVPQWLRFVAGHESLAVGFLMLPMSLGVAVLGPFGPSLQKRFGSRRTLLTSTALLGAGFVVMAFVREVDSFVPLLVGGIISSVGFGFGIAPATATVMNALPVEKAGDGSGANQIARQAGAAFSIAVLGSLLATGYRGNLSLASINLSPSQVSDVEEGIGGASSVIEQLPSPAADALRTTTIQAFDTGTELALLCTAVLALVALVVVWFTVDATDGETVDAPGSDEGATI